MNDGTRHDIRYGFRPKTWQMWINTLNEFKIKTKKNYILFFFFWHCCSAFCFNIIKFIPSGRIFCRPEQWITLLVCCTNLTKPKPFWVGLHPIKSFFCFVDFFFITVAWMLPLNILRWSFCEHRHDSETTLRNTFVNGLSEWIKCFWIIFGLVCGTQKKKTSKTYSLTNSTIREGKCGNKQWDVWENLP